MSKTKSRWMTATIRNAESLDKLPWARGEKRAEWKRRLKVRITAKRPAGAA